MLTGSIIGSPLVIIKNINLIILFLLFFGLFLLSIHFLSTTSVMKLRLICFITLFLDTLIMSLIFTEGMFFNNYILEYKLRILTIPLFGLNHIYEPVYTYGFTFITTITVLAHTYIYYMRRNVHTFLPAYFKIDKNVKFFIFSLLFYDGYFILNFIIDFLLEPNIDLLFENVASTIINIIFLIVSAVTIIYFLYFTFQQPYLFMYLGIKKNLIEKGLIGYFLASMTTNGPEVLIYSEQFKKIHNLEQKTLSDLALYSITSIGIFQESIYKGNMIIPVPDRKEDLIAFTFSIYLKNKSLESDPRYRKGVPTIFAMLLSSDILKSLSNVGGFYTIFTDYLQKVNISQVQQINDKNMLELTKTLIQTL